MEWLNLSNKKLDGIINHYLIKAAIVKRGCNINGL